MRPVTATSPADRVGVMVTEGVREEAVEVRAVDKVREGTAVTVSVKPGEAVVAPGLSVPLGAGEGGDNSGLAVPPGVMLVAGVNNVAKGV